MRTEELYFSADEKGTSRIIRVETFVQVEVGPNNVVVDLKQLDANQSLALNQSRKFTLAKESSPN